MNELLLDTDTLSYFLRNDVAVMAEAANYLKSYSGFTFSIITDYEIQRGLKFKNAARQVEKFDLIKQHSKVLNLNNDLIVRASELYVDLRRSGLLIDDADILIAATALEHNLAVVTNNTTHFDRIPNLRLLNWKQ